MEGRERVASFGEFPGYESAVFELQIDPHAIPLAIYAALPGSSEREFLFVPDGDAVREFPRFAALSHSDALGSAFRYVGGTATEIPVAAADARGSSRRRLLRFALVRWARSSRTPLPEKVRCAVRVPLAREGASLLEVVWAPAVAPAGQEARG